MSQMFPEYSGSYTTLWAKYKTWQNSVSNPNVVWNETYFDMSGLFPDNFGPASLSEAFMVVNDTLYLVAGNDQSATADNLFCTARIRARVVKLSSKDWMAIAIQSTASDN